MSTQNANADRSTAHETTSVRHTKEDALTDLEFELLLDAAYDPKPMQDLETRFILLVGGRLGLRRGEIAHMNESWVDWRKRRIEIPAQQPGDYGRDGGPCGHCKLMAQQQADHNESISYEAALAERWSAKTDMAARSVPYGFSGRTEIVLERFFDEFDRWMYTGQSINRRLEWVTDRVDDVGHVSPHALRATAATFHAGRGLDVLAIQSMFGWAQASTAKRYVASSAENLDRQLQFVHQ